MAGRLSGKRLGLVLATAPARGDGERVERLARAARAAGADVGVFVMDAAAAWAAGPAAAALVDEGCEVVVCATSLDARGLRAAHGVVVGSQDDHAAVVSKADRVVSFT